MPHEIGHAISTGMGTVVDDQVKMFSDASLWIIAIVAVLISMLLGVAAYFVSKENCKHTTSKHVPSCKEQETQKKNLCILSSTSFACMDATTNWMECMNSNAAESISNQGITCDQKALIWAGGVIMVGFLVTGIVRFTVALKHGHGRAMLEQAAFHTLVDVS